jgi:hypothetical protein
MKQFERVIIDELLSSDESKTIVFPELANESKVEFTGAGYFLALKDPSFPKKRIVLDSPDIRGQLDGIDVGYLAFVENHELTLECYSYEHEISAVNREQGFVRTRT